MTEESNIRSTIGWNGDIINRTRDREPESDRDNKKLSNIRTKIILSTNATYDSKVNYLAKIPSSQHRVRVKKFSGTRTIQP